MIVCFFTINKFYHINSKKSITKKVKAKLFAASTSKNANKNKDLYRPTLQITHNNDTLSYQLNGILKILDLTHYYITIMEKFYPIEEIYPFYEIINNEKNNHKIDSIVPCYEIKK